MPVIRGGSGDAGLLSKQQNNVLQLRDQSGIEVCLFRTVLIIKAALVKYLLSCCQYQDGGLRDKPPIRSDFYHTQYSLAGLSAAQHHYVYNPTLSNGHDNGGVSFNWTVTGPFEGEEGDRVATVHPIYVLPWGDAERIRSWFIEKGPVKTSTSL